MIGSSFRPLIRPGYAFASTIKVGDDLYCLPPMDGDPFKGVVRYADDQRVIVEAEGETFFPINRRTMRDRDGDLWVKKAPAKTQWLNIYDDGTIGTTIHDTWEKSVDNSKYGKTRIGILERTLQGGVVVTSRVHRTTPQKRTREKPEGFNPYA